MLPGPPEERLVMFVDRRTLIAHALSAGALSTAALAGRSARAATTPASGILLPPTDNLHFKIIRKGAPFGTYQVLFTKAGDAVTATTDVAMSMRISGVNVFDYRHHCEEVWKAGKFVSLKSTTVRDRKADQTDTVSALRGEFEIKIATSKGPLGAPLNAAPLTHWNAAALKGPLFNPQDGRSLDLNPTMIGHDSFTLASGAPVVGNHWTLRGSQTIDEWYDDAGVWAGLRAVFPDRSVVEYHRL
jgi:hypothetical protein